MHSNKLSVIILLYNLNTLQGITYSIVPTSNTFLFVLQLKASLINESAFPQ